MTSSTSRALTLVLIAAFSSIPFGASAATSKLSCSLTVSTPRGEVTIKDTDDVLVLEKEQVNILWRSTNAKTATDPDGEVVPLSGSDVVFPTTNNTYTYRFSDGKKKTDCSVHLVVASAKLDSSTLSSTTKKPIIEGSAKGTKAVRVTLEDSEGKTVFKGKEVKVKKGEWHSKITKSIREGTYLVTLYGDKGLSLNMIATTTLTVLPKSSSKTGGTIAVSPIPLLMGGLATAGTAVPVAYVKIVNTGKTQTSIEGIKLQENGSAPNDLVIGFATNDDKGGSRFTIGGTEGTKQFKDGLVTVPLPATLAPGQMRIFTIKAILSKLTGKSMGQQFKIDVAGIETKAKVTGTFPIRGTTWTLK